MVTIGRKRTLSAMVENRLDCSFGAAFGEGRSEDGKIRNKERKKKGEKQKNATKKRVEDRGGKADIENRVQI
jgi:hypothetical protein